MLIRRGDICGFVDGMAITLDPGVAFDRINTGSDAHAQSRIKAFRAHPPPKHRGPRKTPRAWNPATHTAQRQGATMPRVGRFQSQHTCSRKPSEPSLRSLHPKHRQKDPHDTQAPTRRRQCTAIERIQSLPAIQRSHAITIRLIRQSTDTLWRKPAG